MDIRFQCLGPDQWKAEILIVPVCQGENMLESCPALDNLAPWLAIAPAMRDFQGKKGQQALLHGHPELRVPRVLAIGLGAREDLTTDDIRTAVATGVQRARELGLESILLLEPQLATLPGGRERLVEESVYAACLALYKYDLKKPAKDAPAAPQWLAVAFEGDFVPDGGQQAARRGERAAEAVCLARRLDNTPSNLLSPALLAEEAQKLAARAGLQCTVLDEKDLAEASMNCLLAVGQGSARPPRLIVLEHAPAGHEQEKPLVLVGKGITFDTGGICLKPAANMHAMKGDMSGAAAVLATLVACAGDELPRRVVGIMACAENMPGGNAMRPGDVVRAASGDTVEIQNTDAEGRLALCDALDYAQKQWTPAAVVDIATLTGACAVALGTQVAGLFCDDDALAEHIRAAGAVGGENYWPLPLWKGYEDNLKSEVADICHMGPREGGAIHAALFLKHFVREGVRWAHLDIAGVDWATKKTALCPVGSTGFGARTLLELARGGV